VQLIPSNDTTSLCVCVSLSHTLSISISISLSLTPTLSISLSLTLTLYTHTLSISLSHTHTLSHSLSPFATVQVRLQVQSTSGVGAYKGMGDAMRQIVRNEGAMALFKGFTPALLRQCTYTPMMMVLYEPIKRVITPDGQAPG
jgi:hypothetical protein